METGSNKNLEKMFKEDRFEDIETSKAIAKSENLSLEIINGTRQFIDNVAKEYGKSLTLKGLHNFHKHESEVGLDCEAIARRYGLSSEESTLIGFAGSYHDIGKVQWPEEFLGDMVINTPELRKIKEMHVITQEEILKPFNLISKLIRHHHERYDGTGYPDRLVGQNIPLGSRIIAIADSFHAMTNKRPYTSRVLSPYEGLEELKFEKERAFDPDLVDIFSVYIHEKLSMNQLKQ